MNIDYRGKQRIYLASPYSHEDPKVMQERFVSVSIASAYLMSMGNVVFSPIVHSHVVAKYLDNALNHKFWLTQDGSHISTCDKVTIYTLDGWTTSFGVTWEIGFANGLHIPITHLTVETVQKWAKKRGIESEYI